MRNFALLAVVFVPIFRSRIDGDSYSGISSPLRTRPADRVANNCHREVQSQLRTMYLGYIQSTNIKTRTMRK